MESGLLREFRAHSGASGPCIKSQDLGGATPVHYLTEDMPYILVGHFTEIQRLQTIVSAQCIYVSTAQ